jgi:hypothetical protein
MKITDKRKYDPVCFVNVPIGSIFKPFATSSRVYMKTSSVVNSDRDVISNAVMLENGFAHFFDDDMEVIPVDAELIIT